MGRCCCHIKGCTSLHAYQQPVDERQWYFREVRINPNQYLRYELTGKLNMQHLPTKLKVNNVVVSLTQWGLFPRIQTSNSVLMWLQQFPHIISSYLLLLIRKIHYYLAPLGGFWWFFEQFIFPTS